MTLDWRKARIAKNEASFRGINERLEADLRRVPHQPDLLDFVCECGDRSCEALVRLSLAEYEDVRRDSRHFAVVPGHVFEDSEQVIASGERFEVVEKTGDAVPVADAADERTAGPEGRRAGGAAP